MSRLNRRDEQPSAVITGQTPVASAIKLSRDRYNMTVRDVAQRVKATPREVDSWERGAALPSPSSWTRLCSTFPWIRGWVGEAGVQMIHGAGVDPFASVKSLPKYTRMLVNEMDRAQMSIGAKAGRKGDGLAGQSGMSEKRCEEILLGAPVSEVEHRRVLRALPRMKAHGRLLLEFVQPAAERPPTPVPPKALVIDVEPRSESVPPPREAHGPDAPPSDDAFEKDRRESEKPVEVVMGTTPGVMTVEEALGPSTASRFAVEETPVLAIRVDAPNAKPALTIKPRTFGEHLRALREREGVTQESLSEILDVKQSTLSAWERDEVRPVKGHLDKLRELFPEIAGAPTIKSRDIPKPAGPGPLARATEQPETIELQGALANGTYQRVSQASPDPMALVQFGLALGEFRTAVRNKVDAVVKLLRAGEAAGLSVGAIADAVENRGR